MIFNSKAFDLRQLLENIKLRIAFWIKAKWPGYNESLIDIVRFPNLIKGSLSVKFVRTVRL